MDRERTDSRDDTVREGGDVTRLLGELRAGRDAAVRLLLPVVYEELRALAARYLRRERDDHTLQPTALVHEAYLRLVAQRDVTWQNRAHFIGVAAQAMRRILMDHARAHRAEKRSGARQRVVLDAADVPDGVPSLELLALDEALGRLARLDPQQAQIAELRFFGGATIEETAELLGISPATVKRDWSVARAWLRREMTRGIPDHDR